jgi:hypothetical protein
MVLMGVVPVVAVRLPVARVVLVELVGCRIFGADMAPVVVEVVEEPPDQVRAGLVVRVVVMELVVVGQAKEILLQRQKAAARGQVASLSLLTMCHHLLVPVFQTPS